MTIDIDTPNSPGWWLAKLDKKRVGRLKRLNLLHSYHIGDPPLPTNVETARESFREFLKTARTNYADVLVGSVAERITVRDIRTALSGEDVDDEAQRIWKENGLDVEFADVIENMLALGDSFMMVGKDSDSDELIVTGEDPRQVVTIHNPVKQSEIRAASKTFHDPDEEKDYIFLFIKGQWDEEANAFGPAMRYVASRKSKGSPRGPLFSKSAWSWDDEFGGADGEPLPHSLVPVVRFRNRRGVGEFEPHLDLLNRINDTVYQRMVITLYQAFKQRVVHMDEDEDDEDEGADGSGAEKLTLDDVLTSDPGSWIQLPKDATIWESTQADLNGILSAIKDDVKQLAAVTRRPLSILAPDNQSATGASFTREGLTFATEDKMTRAAQALRDLFYLIFLTLEDTERADRSKIIIGWMPTERHSLSDMYSAVAQAQGSLAKRTIWREILQKTPEEIRQLASELADEMLLVEDLNAPANTA